MKPFSGAGLGFDAFVLSPVLSWATCFFDEIFDLRYLGNEFVLLIRISWS